MQIPILRTLFIAAIFIATTLTAFPDNKTDRVDELFARWDKSDSPGCALAIVRDAGVVYKQGYGMANLEYNVPITPSTVFHVASVSKQFTAFAVLLLEDEGKLSLDDDIRKHLPEMHDFGDVITVRHLVHHVSGLRDQWELAKIGGWRMDDVITQEHLLKLLFRQRELNFKPGDRYAYCNSGYTLLAEIVHRVSGKPFDEFCRERIFEPLGMTDTHFHMDIGRIVPNRAYSYYPSGNGFTNATLNFANAGATGLFTTVLDMAKWDQNFFNAKVGGKRVVEKMHEKAALNNGKEITYACGLSVEERKGLKTVGHTGADAGFRSAYIQYPQQRFSVIVFSNASNFDYGLQDRIAYIFLADEFAKAEKEKQPKQEQRNTNANEDKKAEPTLSPRDDLSVYEGTYYSDELETYYTIALREDGNLYFTHPRHSDSVLRPLSRDRFKTSNPNAGSLVLQFTCNDGGAPHEFLIDAGDRVRNLRFEKIRIEPNRSSD